MADDPFGVIGVGSAVLIGTWAARRGVLTDPVAHRVLLVRAAVAGVTLAVAGGLPAGLAVTGVARGLGCSALIGLAAIRVGDRPGRAVRALVACRQRSLSCYLFQSVVFVTLLLPFTLGLGATLGSAEVTVLALGTWLVSVLLAELMCWVGAARARRGVAAPTNVWDSATMAG